MKRFLISGLLCTLSTTVYADSRIGIGGLLNYGQDNTSTLGTGYINSYSQGKDRFINFMPIGEIYIEKKVSDKTYYGGVYPKRDFFGANIGVKKQSSRTDSVDLFVVYNPFRSVWEDPLELNIDRKATNQREFGAGVMFDKKYFSINTIAAYSDVEVDKLGERFNDLKRDGFRVENRVYANIRLADGLFFKPGIMLENFRAEGKASSYDSPGISLNLVYRKKDYILITFLNTELQQYLKTDPVFGKKREDSNTTLFSILTKRKFVHQKGYISLVFGVNYRNSNIEFYDASRLFLAFITGYSF